jgi:NAD(P)-dependent dehydrogenase (short-subunit alcohol dehydrogenase family)
MTSNGSSARVAVVTGASAGVGRAVARRFGELGWDVGLLARGIDGLDVAADEIVAAGGRALAIPTDVSIAEEVEAAAEEVERRLGPIDVWVNDAMVSVFAEFLDIEPDEFEQVTRVTYLGYANGTRAALKRMVPRDRGVVVQVGSALAERSIPLQSAYCAAKHAIEGLTESVRVELLHKGSNVRIPLVQLPAVNTPQFDWSLSKMPRMPMPVPPIYQPEVVAHAIVHAAMHPRKEVWVGGRNALGIMGNRLVPGLLDHYLARVGYRAQMSAQPDPGDRPSNLWKALPGDRGARGRFDDRARRVAPQVWLTEHRGVVGGALAAVGFLLGRRRRRRTAAFPQVGRRVTDQP